MNNIKLTKNELTVLNQLAKGYTLKEIAQKLDKSYHSIQQFTRRLYQKFNVDNRLNLILAALELKIISYSSITKKFRERFCMRPNIEDDPIKLREPLTQQELDYLRLALQHNTKKQIIEKLNILNVNFCNYIISEICYKLNARNLTQAAYHAGILNLIDLD